MSKHTLINAVLNLRFYLVMNEMLVSLELLMERKSKAPADVSDIFFDPLWYLVPNSREAQ